MATFLFLLYIICTADISKIGKSSYSVHFKQQTSSNRYIYIIKNIKNIFSVTGNPKIIHSWFRYIYCFTSGHICQFVSGDERRPCNMCKMYTMSQVNVEVIA